MSHQRSSSSSRSNSSDHAFPFQHEDGTTHQSLLPDGILNDEDDIVPWPRKTSREETFDKSAMLKVRRLPQDLTAREFAGLFLMADGFMHSDLVLENEERIGIATFATYGDAEKTKQKMSSVTTGPFARLSFEVTSRRAQDMSTPPATLSSSSKSTLSNSSMPQISRLASYVKEKSNDSQIGLDDFYGKSSSVPKSGGLSTSVPTNFSNSAGGASLWSPTSPRYNIDLGKSPPNGLSMLPPPTSKDDESWNRSGTQNSVNSQRFAQMSISTANPSQDVRMQQSPTLNNHNGGTPMYSSIDDSLHSLGVPRSPYSSNPNSSLYHTSSPPKHYMATSAYPNNNGSVFGGHRMGPPTPINTNPADQNPPCNTLYVGNLPLATTEEELKSLFSRQPGYRRLCYRTKSNGPMCFVEFEDVNFAINSLKLLQGVILSSSIKGGIRLSFSKNPLGVRKMDGGHGTHNGPMSNPAVNNGVYNAMHAPPGLQSGQSHGHHHHHHQQVVNPIWR